MGKTRATVGLTRGTRTASRKGRDSSRHVEEQGGRRAHLFHRTRMLDVAESLDHAIPAEARSPRATSSRRAALEAARRRSAALDQARKCAKAPGSDREYRRACQREREHEAIGRRLHSRREDRPRRRRSRSRLDVGSSRASPRGENSRPPRTTRFARVVIARSSRAASRAEVGWLICAERVGCPLVPEVSDPRDSRQPMIAGQRAR